MNIHGFQRLTLLDFPGKLACTVFTPGCNLRCPYCHNLSLLTESAPEDKVVEANLFDYLEKRRGLLEGVCLTGGEPLLQNKVADILKRIKGMGYLIKLDTNGFFPAQLKNLILEGLVDYVAMDIKGSPDNYPAACGVSNVELTKVEESIEFLLSGRVDYEFRTTTVKGLHDQGILLNAAKMIKGAKRYYLQKFVDPGNLENKSFSSFSWQEITNIVENLTPYIKEVELRGYDK